MIIAAIAHFLLALLGVSNFYLTLMTFCNLFKNRLHEFSGIYIFSSFLVCFIVQTLNVFVVYFNIFELIG